jgi:hypothetical protein
MVIPLTAGWDHRQHAIDSSMGRIDFGVYIIAFIEDAWRVRVSSIKTLFSHSISSLKQKEVIFCFHSSASSVISWADACRCNFINRSLMNGECDSRFISKVADSC